MTHDSEVLCMLRTGWRCQTACFLVSLGLFLFASWFSASFEKCFGSHRVLAVPRDLMVPLFIEVKLHFLKPQKGMRESDWIIDRPKEVSDKCVRSDLWIVLCGNKVHRPQGLLALAWFLLWTHTCYVHVAPSFGFTPYSHPRNLRNKQHACVLTKIVAHLPFSPLGFLYTQTFWLLSDFQCIDDVTTTVFWTPVWEGWWSAHLTLCVHGCTVSSHPVPLALAGPLLCEQPISVLPTQTLTVPRGLAQLSCPSRGDCSFFWVASPVYIICGQLILCLFVSIFAVITSFWFLTVFISELIVLLGCRLN